MRHNYSYINNRYNVIRLVTLAVALLSDFVNIFMLISAIFDPKILIYIAITFVTFLLLRISTIYMTYTVEYSYYKGVLKVAKIFYRKPYLYISLDKNEIISIEPFDNIITAEDISIYSKTCIYDTYRVKLANGKSLILSLDDTMYSLLTCEEQYDLFR